MKKHLFSIFIAIITSFAVQMTAFAAEASFDEFTAECPSVTVELDSGIVTYGSLSGYASHTHHYGDKSHGSFTIEVTGSWSPFAGWTVKTDFPPDGCEFLYVYLTRPDGSKIGENVYPGPRDEVKNQALFNVPPGTYTVWYGLNTVYDGTITVYIY